jgi:hypothetical protein
VRPRSPFVADLVPGNRSIAPDPKILRQRLNQSQQDVARALRHGERRCRVALIEIERSKLVERRSLETDELGCAIASLHELALQVLHPFEDEPHEIERHAGAIA